MSEITALANLRHAYSKLATGTVVDQKQLADGLVAPAICTLEAALSRPIDPKAEVEPVVWRPIETAPKDGKIVMLAWSPEDWTTGQGFYRDGKWVAVGTFYNPSAGNPPYEFRQTTVKPAMWWPMPSAPGSASPSIVAPGGVPDGWQLVPKEPTQEMFLSAEKAGVFFATQQKCWGAMLAAAPAFTSADGDKGARELWSRNDLAKGLAMLDGITLHDVKATVGDPQDADNWREYLGRADDLLAHLSRALSTTKPAQGDGELARMPERLAEGVFTRLANAVLAEAPATATEFMGVKLADIRAALAAQGDDAQS